MTDSPRATPLTAEELDAIRGRDASARNPARTWAVEDRRRDYYAEETGP